MRLMRPNSMLELHCFCGHQFEVPEDVRVGKCPKCGRKWEVQATVNTELRTIEPTPQGVPG